MAACRCMQRATVRPICHQMGGFEWPAAIACSEPLYGLHATEWVPCDWPAAESCRKLGAVMLGALHVRKTHSNNVATNAMLIVNLSECVWLAERDCGNRRGSKHYICLVMILVKPFVGADPQS